MKKLRMFIVILLMITLSSCRQDKPVVTEMLFPDETIEYQIGEDVLTDFQVEVIYSDESSEHVTLTEELVEECKADMFETVGLKEVTFIYDGFKQTISFRVYETSLDLELLAIFEKALESNTTNMTYEEWLNSIKGEDGKGIESISIVEGDLVIEYTDGTTVNVGRVVGVQGEQGPPGVGETTVYHLVNFYSIQGFIISSQLVEDGHGAESFTPLMPDGYIFDSWIQDVSSVTSDIDVFMNYSIEKFDISFNAEGVDPINNVEYGNTITLPILTRDGFEFLGWFYNGAEVDKSTPIMMDMMLEPMFEEMTYTITYLSHGGTDIEEEMYLYSDITLEPDSPMKEGVYFNGWFYDQEGTMPVDFSMLPKEDTTIHAQWLDLDVRKYRHTNFPELEYYIIYGLNGDYMYVNLPSMINGIEVKEIATRAFYHEQFAYISIPDTITTIGAEAFAFNDVIMEITLPNTVHTLGGYAFEGCSSLETVHLSSLISQIPVGSFKDSGLESFVIHEGVTMIRTDSFKNTNISEIILPSTLTTIQVDAFSGTKLKSVVLPEGLINLYQGAFSDIDTLEEINIPSTVSFMQGGFLNNNPSLQSVTLPETNTSFEMIDGVIYDESISSVIYYPEYLTNTSYTIPDTIFLIQDKAVNCNPYLETVHIPSSISMSSFYMNFMNMENLSSFQVYEISGSVDFVAVDGVLYNSAQNFLVKYPMGRDESSFTVPTGVTHLTIRAFYNADNLTSLTLPDGLISLLAYSLSDMDNIPAITLPNSLQYINDYAFYNSDSITSLNIPGSVYRIDSYAFAEMDSLTTLTLNEGTDTLYSYILYNTPGVTDIHIPSTMDQISYGTFTGASGLQNLTVEATSVYYRVDSYGALYTYNNFALVAYPEGLTHVTFTPSYGIVFMGADFGRNPYLKTIGVPSTVESFYSNFKDLPNLEAIHVYRIVGNEPPSLTNYNLPFHGDYTIYIYGLTYDDYLLENYWKEYIDRMVLIY